MKCTECGSVIERTMRTCTRCGASIGNISEADSKAQDTLLGSFIRGLHDYFNPALHAVDEAVLDAAKKSKQRR
ncbi:MAG: hypothetical protein ACXV5B_07915 [Halobacteriota archaeon]